MKRILGVFFAVVLLMGVPAAGHATDIRDGKACNESDESFVDVGLVNNPDAEVDSADRSAVCVRSGGTTFFYLGGEAQAEDPNNGGETNGFPTGLCGALIIYGQTYSSGHEDRNRNNSGGEFTGPYPEGTWTAAERDANWDFMHSHGPGPSGFWRTEDDDWHHHHCD